MFSFALAEREECSTDTVNKGFSKDAVFWFFGFFLVMLMSTAKQCKHIIEACDIYAKHIAVYEVYNKATILACHLKVLLFFSFLFFACSIAQKVCAEKLQF